MKKVYLLFIALLIMNLVHAQWQQTNGPYIGTINGFAISGNNIFAASSSGFCKSTDNGLNWTSLNTITPIFSIASDGNIILAGTGMNILLSNDNGASWITVYPEMGIVSSFAFNGDKVFTATEYGVYTSDREGFNWTFIDNSLISYLNYPASIFTKGDTIIVGACFGMAISRNDGLDWAYANNGLSCGVVNCITNIGDSILVGTNGGGIYLSADYGATWITKSKGLTYFDITAIGSNNGKVYAGTNSGGVFISKDNGENWESYNEGLPSNCTVNAFTFKNNEVFIGTSQNSIWRRSETESIDDFSDPYPGLNIFPNPATATISIELQMSDWNINSELAVYNPAGCLQKKQSFIDNKAQLNITTLSPGLYIIRVTSNNTVKVGKFVKE
jgi:photosystem II stability/assembly factor-like uncharacterized protein